MLNMNEIIERELSVKELKENRYPCGNSVAEAYEWSHADVDRKVLCIIESDDISENPMEGWFGWTLAETSGWELHGEMEHLFRVVEDTDAYKAREAESTRVSSILTAIPMSGRAMIPYLNTSSCSAMKSVSRSTS